MEGRERPHSLPDDQKIPQNWPDEGEVVIKNLSVRYREGLPLVLKNLNLEIKGGSRVAILGRTGSGKSTLMLALMRILEPCEDQETSSGAAGSVEIDGRDISKIGLKRLRASLSMIPQNPFLMEGTLRSNLDQRMSHREEEILKIVEMVGLIDTLTTTPIESASSSKSELGETSRSQKDPNEVLGYKIEAKGANLSAGQRQLVCIARALLEGSKILLIDEATASIHKSLDKKIQRILTTELKGRTVITIAHRLETVLGYDKVVVMGDGRLVEEGSPAELVEAKGEFWGMMQQTELSL